MKITLEGLPASTEATKEINLRSKSNKWDAAQPVVCLCGGGGVGAACGRERRSRVQGLLPDGERKAPEGCFPDRCASFINASFGLFPETNEANQEFYFAIGSFSSLMVLGGYGEPQTALRERIRS